MKRDKESEEHETKEKEVKGKGVAMVTMVRYEMWVVVRNDDGEAKGSRAIQSSSHEKLWSIIKSRTTNIKINPTTLCSRWSCICK